MEMQTQRTNLWTQIGKEMVRRIGRVALETHFSEVKEKSLSRVQLLATLWTVAP